MIEQLLVQVRNSRLTIFGGISKRHLPGFYEFEGVQKPRLFIQ